MKEQQPRTKVTHFRNSNFNVKTSNSNEKAANSAKTCAQKILRTRKVLRTRNCRSKFFKIEKRKENKKTKQPRFKLRLNNFKSLIIVL